MLVDVHSHLDFHQFNEDLDKVIDRAKKAGVKAIISNGTNPESNRKTLEIAKKFDIIKPALGAYPLDILGLQKTPKFNLDKELEFIKNNKNSIIAIGEVGLDNYHFPGKLGLQKPNFEKIINLAEKLNKPIIVHSRKAELECIGLLESSNLKRIIMHCFGGNKQLIKRIIDNNWSFSIPTSIVRSKHFQLITELAGIRNLLTETDAPFLSPFPEKRNEPAFIIEAIKKIAEIKQLTIEDTSNTIFQNYQEIFT